MTAKSLVSFVLDRSGSMALIQDDTIGGFNTYLNTLKSKAVKGLRFSLTQFDTQSVDEIYKAVKIKEVKELTKETFVPRSGTPLIDTVCRAIKSAEQYADKDTKVVISILTDGQENSSTEFEWDDLKRLISQKEELGWEFDFMGAGIDAYAQGARMGVPDSNTMSYDKSDSRATMDSFRARASNTVAFAAGAAQNMAYSADQKLKAKDKFDPARK
jgi:hypothetical protein